MDYAEPISPSGVCSYLAERMKWLADDHRRKAAEHIAIAEELDDLRRSTEQDARQFDHWQEKPEPETTST